MSAIQNLSNILMHLRKQVILKGRLQNFWNCKNHIFEVRDENNDLNLKQEKVFETNYDFTFLGVLRREYLTYFNTDTNTTR